MIYFNTKILSVNEIYEVVLTEVYVSIPLRCVHVLTCNWCPCL